MNVPARLGPIARVVRAFLDAKITAVLVVATTLVGLFAIAMTPREENPRITVPPAIVATNDQGRSRAEIEQLVTGPPERVIGQIAGVEHVYATSQDGRSTITVRYRVGTDTTQAYVDLYTRLLGNRGVIPADAADPIVTRIDVDDVPVVVLTLSSSSLDEGALRDLAYRMSDAIAPLPGVGGVTLYGGRSRAVSVVLDPQRLRGYGIGFSDLDPALRTNAEQPAGYVTDGPTRTYPLAGNPRRRCDRRDRERPSPAARFGRRSPRDHRRRRRSGREPYDPGDAHRDPRLPSHGVRDRADGTVHAPDSVRRSHRNA